MAYTYRITYLLGALDNTVSPPPVVSHIFPNYDGTQTVMSDCSEILVTFATPQTPADLGPLVKVELLPSE
jgi:hypothetical protein